MYTSIVEAVTTALEPAELELVDDSASHAGHSGMKGKEAVEVCFCAALCVQSQQFWMWVCESCYMCVSVVFFSSQLQTLRTFVCLCAPPRAILMF